MHGLIGKMTAVEGKRDDLITILLQGTGQMPGCLSYIVARDPLIAGFDQSVITEPVGGHGLDPSPR